MKRRNFLAGVGAVSALPLLRATIRSSPTTYANDYAPADLIRPKALRLGDTVGLITPATEVPEPERLDLAERTINYFKLRMKRGRNVGKRFGTYRESVAARLDDLHTMFRDPDVKAVFCIRGGYGSMQLLDRIDYDLIRRNPKIFIGYSDITAMHLAINRHAGLVTFHGPIVLSSFTDYTQQSFRAALLSTKPAGKLTNPPEHNQL